MLIESHCSSPFSDKLRDDLGRREIQLARTRHSVTWLINRRRVVSDSMCLANAPTLPDLFMVLSSSHLGRPLQSNLTTFLTQITEEDHEAIF